MSVPNSNPPMIEAANEPNIASGNSGIIPRIVVSEAIITGRRRLWELSINAVTGSTPWLICNVISSISTIPFFIIIPINPNVPTIATKLNVFPVSNITATTPTKTNGMQQKMIIGLR